MLSDTVSASILTLAMAFAWRNVSEDKQETTDPLTAWNGITQQAQKMFLAQAERFRLALVEVEDALDAQMGDQPATG